MNAQTSAAPTQETTNEYDSQRPYQDYSALQLVESLEVQCDRGEPYDEGMVWELAARACELEALQGR
ncbi:MAG: hypothetical protein ACRDYX_23370 [Egibacteraceae bacterium]